MFKYLFHGPPTITKLTYDFKMQHSFAKRREESTKIISKYKDKVLIILEKSESSRLPSLSKQKYLLNNELSVGQFIFMLRRHLALQVDQIIYLSINNNYTPGTAEIFKDLYAQFKDADGFMYITYL